MRRIFYSSRLVNEPHIPFDKSVCSAEQLLILTILDIPEQNLKNDNCEKDVCEKYSVTGRVANCHENVLRFGVFWAVLRGVGWCSAFNTAIF